MIAARLLGEGRFGLSDLVTKHLGVSLEKGLQKADWARRPLTDKMMAYARNDTRYLKPLADLLKNLLATVGRLDWLRESCERLVAECARPPAFDRDLNWRIKGSHHLSRAALAVLRELWRWREAEAIASNRPPFFILQHETLVALAVAAVESSPTDPLLPKRLPDHRRNGLRDAIAAGLALPEQDQPDFLRAVARRLTEPEKRRFLDLQARRDRHATELGIDPTLIASKATLVWLAQDWTKHQSELMDWQRTLLA
jgi:ribonuclease D